MSHHIDLDTLVLSAGAHSPDGVMCLLEAVSQYNSEPWSDHPASVSPVLAAFGRAWNDGMRTDEERASLKQYIPLLIGTAGDPAADETRAWMATDWLLRTALPAWLRLAKLVNEAEALASKPPVRSKETIPQAELQAGCKAAYAARAAAWDAAWAAAWDAARAAAWDAAWAAAWDAARDAAWAAAWDAAWAAARDAAWAAARDAAGAAAGDALEPTVKELQASAHDLYRRMIAVGKVAA